MVILTRINVNWWIKYAYYPSFRLYSINYYDTSVTIPNCNKKTFIYYIDAETGDYLPQQYGCCDRESKCSYHLNPYSDGCLQQQKVTNATAVKQKYFCSQLKQHTVSETQPQLIYFDFETFRKTLEPQRYEKNMFIQNLFYRVQFPFEVSEVTKVIQLYRKAILGSNRKVRKIRRFTSS